METPKGRYECAARGKFRKEGISPLAGDIVRIGVTEDMKGVIEEILPRKNFLVRPPVANIDNLLILSSVKSPDFQAVIVDKAIAVAELNGIEPVLIVTKTDLNDKDDLPQRIQGAYERAGIHCVLFSAESGEGIDAAAKIFQNHLTVLTGNSGTGKSTLLNCLYPELSLKTGTVSQKLGRGKHTTREAELYKLKTGGYVADTAGFSTFDLLQYGITDKDELVKGFREFVPYTRQCRFASCSHTVETGCAVLRAAKNGEISRSRIKSYTSMYHEIKDIKPWQINKNA